METLIGLVMLVVWCGSGFLGASVRESKGYHPGTVGIICRGGPLYLLIALLTPARRA